MKLLWASLLLGAALLSVDAAEDYTCPTGASNKKMFLAPGEAITFRTQAKDLDYEANTKCKFVIRRKKKNNCKLTFSCSSFSLIAKRADCKRGSDFLKIGKNKFCGEDIEIPTTTTNKKSLVVLFKSHKNSAGDEGAECTASCEAPTTAPIIPTVTSTTTTTPTVAPTTTTTTTITTTTATTASPTTGSCPAERPTPGTACSLPGLECFYGEECCCGQCHHSFKAICDSTWQGLNTEACLAFAICPVTQLPPTGSTAAPVPNPGSAGGTFEIKITQSWSQETNYDRITSVKVPATTAGQKLPLVVDLHGNGGQGNVNRLSYLGEGVVIAAPSGYERSWNINNEKSKADDVAFLLELIATVTVEHPSADAKDVTIVGTSNGAAMIYRLLIATMSDRPFHRVLPMVSSLISVQWHDGQFWKAASGTAGTDFTVPVVLEFSDTFEYAHFHGTNDGAIAYEGKSPGPNFLGTNVDVIAAQKTDFLFAQAMGYTGEQLADSAGVTIGSDFVEYTYLDGRVKHFKEVGGTHGSTFGNALTKEEVRKMILGTA